MQRWWREQGKKQCESRARKNPKFVWLFKYLLIQSFTHSLTPEKSNHLRAPYYRTIVQTKWRRFHGVRQHTDEAHVTVHTD